MRKQLTPEQIAKRDERKAKFKALWKTVADTPELERIQLANKMGFQTCEGHPLSLCNSMLIALQCPTASILGGFRQWIKHGRCVRKGEHGAMIWVPTGSKKTEAMPADAPAGTVAEGDGNRFIIGTLFDIGQTDAIEDANEETPRIAEGRCSTIIAEEPETKETIPMKQTKPNQIDADVLTILRAATITSDSVQLNGQLDRKLYLKVNKYIEMAGGVWNRGRKAHIFAQNPREVLNLDAGAIQADAMSATAIDHALDSGVRVASAPDLFPTPKDLAKQIVELAEIEPHHRILEPSAGTGNLVLAVFESIPLSHWPKVQIVAVEINQALAARLKKSRGTDARCADFLSCNGDLGKFDRIVMNPPFSRGLDIKHIKHAATFLNPGGRLVAICANGPKQQEELASSCEEWIDLPDGSFKESGTDVRTAIVVISNKQQTTQRQQELL